MVKDNYLSTDNPKSKTSCPLCFFKLNCVLNYQDWHLVINANLLNFLINWYHRKHIYEDVQVLENDIQFWCTRKIPQNKRLFSRFKKKSSRGFKTMQWRRQADTCKTIITFCAILIVWKKGILYESWLKVDTAGAPSLDSASWKSKKIVVL